MKANELIAVGIAAIFFLAAVVPGIQFWWKERKERHGKNAR